MYIVHIEVTDYLIVPRQDALGVAVGVAVPVYQVSLNYPAVAEAEKLLCNHQDTIPNMQRLKIPVLCLRWTQASIDRKMMCGDGESIFKLVDQLERENKKPGDINKHLDVVQYQKNFLSLSNRRLAALTMYQSLHRDRIVKAWCRICSNNTEEQLTFTTTKTLGQYDYITQLRAFCDWYSSCSFELEFVRRCVLVRPTYLTMIWMMTLLTSSCRSWKSLLPVWKRSSWTKPGWPRMVQKGCSKICTVLEVPMQFNQYTCGTLQLTTSKQCWQRKRNDVGMWK